jgi:tetratricopeptide (TPR) repeat protein
LEHGRQAAQTGTAADVWLAVARGAVVAVALDLLAYIAQVGALAGSGRGRAELATGLALAALAGMGVARALRARRATSALEPARPRRAILPALLALACVVAPAFALHASTVIALRPTACATLDVFLIALLPASALIAACGSGRTPIASFAFGMFAGYAALELALLPALGWTASIALVALAWVACELARARGAAERESPPALDAGASLDASARVDAGAWLGAAWGVVAGAFATCIRPLVFQHVDSTRPGSTALVVIALLGVWAGAWLSAGLRRIWSSRWLALVPFAFTIVAAWLCARSLATSVDVALPSITNGSGMWSPQSLLQGWFYLGFPAVALGALICALHPRGAWTPALVLCGMCGGIWTAERIVLPRLAQAHASAPQRLPDLVHHPSNSPATALAWNPDGIAARYREASMLDPADVVHWQTRAWERDASWKAIEDAEIRLAQRALPDAGSLWIVGHAGAAHREILKGAKTALHVLDPLPSADEARASEGASPTSILWEDLGARPCVVLLADPQPSASFSLRNTESFLRALERRVVRSHGTLWAWCDPSALAPRGVARALSSWAEKVPAATMYVLQDGYAGPLVGVAFGAASESPASDELAALVACRAPAAECVAASSARSASLDWPALEWLCTRAISSGAREPATEAAGEHRAGVLESLAATLSTPASRDCGRMLGVLAVHARAQTDRVVFQSKWDRIAIPDAEVDAALSLLRERPASEPALRMIENLLRVLFEKREYDVVLDLAKRALELRPDVVELHRMLGRVRHELLDPDGAIAEYELARALDPASLVIKTELARIYAETSRWEPAVRLLEEAWTEISPPDPGVAKALGMAYLELGRNAQARPLLEFAREQAPTDGDLRAALDRLDRQKR